jgi:hypothetical protein
VGGHDNNPPDIDCCQQSRRNLTTFSTVVSTQVRLVTLKDMTITVLTIPEASLTYPIVFTQLNATTSYNFQ